MERWGGGPRCPALTTTGFHRHRLLNKANDPICSKFSLWSQLSVPSRTWQCQHSFALGQGALLPEGSQRVGKGAGIKGMLCERDGIWHRDGSTRPSPRTGEQLEHRWRMLSPWQRDSTAGIKDTVSWSTCRGFCSPAPRDCVLITVASYSSWALLVPVRSSPGKPGERFLGGAAPETRLRVKWFASLAAPSHAHTP